MSRMFSGVWVWSGYFGCGVGERGWVAESGGVVSPCGPTYVASELGTVGVVFVGLVGNSAGAGPSFLASVVSTFGGSSF